MKTAEEIYHRFVRYEWEGVSDTMKKSILEAINEALRRPTVSVSALSDEEMREPIENALYATRRFLTTQATDLAEGIIQYIKDAGYIIVRTER